MNKKRNTFLIFEILLRENSDAYLCGNKTKYNNVSSILEKFFNPNTELGKEVQIYLDVLDYKERYVNKTSETNTKLFELAKIEHNKLNKTSIFNEQTKLISEIDKTLGKNIYSSFVPEYKVLMNLYSYIDDSMNIIDKLNINEQINLFIENKESKNTELEYIDTIVFHSLIEKFNNKYKDLLGEQKILLGKYVASRGEDIADFIIYLNEEISKISNTLNKCKQNKNLNTSNLFEEKVDEILKKLSEFKNTKNITKEMLETVLKTQMLCKEIEIEN